VFEESKCLKYPTKIAELREKAFIRVPNHWECRLNKRLVYRVYVPPIPSMWTTTTHRPCAHNEWHGLTTRVLNPTPAPSKRGVQILKREARGLAAQLRGYGGPFVPWDLRRVCMLYDGAKRTRYLNAEKSLINDGPATKLDARLSTFVKGDKLRFESGRKDPRIIQARSARYNLEMASFLKPIEHALYNLKGDYREGGNRTRLIVKGLNQKERAQLIDRKMAEVPDCAVVGIDMKRFDSHVSVEQLRVEHSVYLKCLADSRFQQLLSWQVRNRGTTMNGIKYGLTGGRMSGDMNTALGNCVLMILMCKALMRKLRIPKWDLACDGDDTLLFVPKAFVETLARDGPGVFLEFGHEVVFESLAYTMEEVLHCQARPVWTGGGYYTMVRNPAKSLSNALTAFRHFHEPKGGMKVMKSIAQCELVLNRGVPVLQCYAENLLRVLREVAFAKLPPDSTLLRRATLEAGSRWQDVVGCPITTASRISFEQAWGWPIEAQLAAEETFSRLRFEDLDLRRMCKNDIDDDWSDTRVETGRSWDDQVPWGC